VRRGTDARRRRDYLPVVVRGSGPPVLLCHGFGMAPRAYAGVTSRLEHRVTLFLPSLFRTSGRWENARVLAGLTTAVDRRGYDRITVIGHSFGGGVALSWAAQHPARIERLVLVDSLGLSASWQLARDAMVGTHFVRMATWPAMREFSRSLRVSPVAVARAGWWAFSCDKGHEIEAIGAAGIPTEVIWGADDSLLPTSRGRAFAERLGANFTVVEGGSVGDDGRDRRGGGTVVEHDWPLVEPDLFVTTLVRLGVVP
jgi:pimeloyl-ACP methyl ester carboxylesterase